MSKIDAASEIVSKIADVACDVSPINTIKKAVMNEKVHPVQVKNGIDKFTTDEDGNKIDEPGELLDNGVRIIGNAAESILDVGKFVFDVFF